MATKEDKDLRRQTEQEPLVSCTISKGERQRKGEGGKGNFILPENIYLSTPKAEAEFI
jgi:hypothetical protein